MSLLAGKLPNGWVVSVVVLVASLAAQMGVSLLGQWSFKPNSVALAGHTYTPHNCRSSLKWSYCVASWRVESLWEEVSVKAFPLPPVEVPRK